MASFVFYDSFLDTSYCFDKGAADFIFHAAQCLAGRERIEDQPMAYAAAITQMRASVISAKERYDKAKEDGAKGGRPSKQEYIPPEEWQAYRKNHSQEETAEHFGIALRTLRNWERGAKTGKNLNVNVNDNVNDNANVNVNDIININKNNNGSADASALTGIVLPELKEGERWVSEPYKMRNGTWIADYEDLSGEVRCKVLGEP